MSSSILVAYATKKGSTREVAEAIADQLGRHDLATTVLAAGDVGDLAGCDGVVLGGSLYMGRWHADAIRLLEQHRKSLATVPLAVFAMGPMTTEARDLESSRAQLDRALAKTPDVVPVTVAVFGGVLDPGEHHFPFSRMPASDARDWDAIRAWADEVAETLGAEVAVLA